jgi:LysM repeat protein
MRRWQQKLHIALVLTLTWASFAQAEGPPRSRGARPIALGNAYTAVSGDSYSLFYNPAGLYDLNQQEAAIDFGRFYSPKKGAGSDFNGIFAMPYKYHDQRMPIAAGIYGEGPVPGAHIVEVTGGAAMDLPADRLTNGFFKLPVHAGAALTIRQQGGEGLTDRVGKGSLGFGLTGGVIVPINRDHQMGLAIRNLSPGKNDPAGPSIDLGVVRHHNQYLDMFADLEFASGGIWRFRPGLEWLVARGVLRPRLGWGYREDGGIDSVSTGIGFNLSPVQIDIAYLIPVKTVNDNAGQFRASLVYRFGRPQFSEIYYDRALEQAGQLDVNVLQLTVKEAELKSSLNEIEQKRKIAGEELENMKGRIGQLKGQDLLGERDSTIRDLKTRVKELEGRNAEYRNRAEPKKPEIKTHLVQPGDTLQSIARRYYGDPNQWKKIYSANVDKIERGLPKQGSRLVIP